ncbi:MAG: tRNA epoxyqueuosine(34) reductase QueG [Hyphomonadaceae bacterium]|nr:tRNA epoxyqueuosine(34) reductase QueG [Hyphomonadaceae bacterium]MBC6412680.1 tRNA epoxyqueuosine(34) reductase QueG [Hyphomonadaceae bacterium]
MFNLPGRVRQRIIDLGLTEPFIADLSETSAVHGERLSEFLGNQYHGSMSWLASGFERRKHPQALWPEAKSAIILGMNYGPDNDPLVNLETPEKAMISVYARNRDYHDVMKGRLKEVAGLIVRDCGADAKVFVDTAPLMEKPLAQQAGMGWQGKHTNLVSRDYGSWLFIGTILTTARMDPGPPEIDHCGSCRACLDICPTNAFPRAYELDARLCISYLTIEHDGPVETGLREKMGNRVYGCDDCLAVCPWNKFARIANETGLLAQEDLKAPDLAELIKLTEAEFRRKFSGSPIKRIGWARFIRNVIYAIGNSGASHLIELLKPFEHHPDPVLQDAAQWAISRLK